MDHPSPGWMLTEKPKGGRDKAHDLGKDVDEAHDLRVEVDGTSDQQQASNEDSRVHSLCKLGNSESIRQGQRWEAGTLRILSYTSILGDI